MNVFFFNNLCKNCANNLTNDLLEMSKTNGGDKNDRKSNK